MAAQQPLHYMCLMPLTRRQSLAAISAILAPEKTLQPPAAKVPVVLDTDTYNEIDDQYAVAYALLSPARMDVEAVYAAPYLNNRSTSAGDGMERSYQEILRILKFLGRSHEGFAFRGSARFFEAAGKPVDSPAARHAALRADRRLPRQRRVRHSDGAAH